ncbi:uncharacterized protein [Anoplolepis gracilipes]|uniref:uncharacterized protein n=1 Tax=Anoplolepis gracilipes TaxID=354296 RepID=UPI003BA24BC9
MSVPTFVEQGFVVSNKFIAKEVAVLRRRPVLAHYIFRSPIPWHLLTKSEKCQASWLMANHHGVQWEDGIVAYSMAKRLITIAVVKEEDDKMQFLFFYSISLKRRAIRILSRRYALTTTEFKFLEIGINVGTPSYVEIVIGDHQGKELVLSLETWKGLYEQRRNIHDLLRKDSKDTYNFISVGPLTVRVHTINDTKLISLESLNVRMMMIEPTLHRMFDLDQCIDVTFDRLVRITETVDTKFTQFSNIASTITDNKKVSNVICASDAFNKHQLVDCELVTLVFSHNM